MAHIYLSGGNRGIGYELCKQLQQSGHTVVTSVRQSSEQLDRLGVDVITGIDLAQARQPARACSRRSAPGYSIC